MPIGIKGFVKGQRFSDQHRKRLSESHAGRRLSKTTEFKNGMIPWNKGKASSSPAWNKGLLGVCEKNSGSFNSERQMGHQVSEQARGRIRASRIGALNPMWKGGVTTEQKARRHCARYRQWRTDVFQRDGFSCRMPGCRKRGGELNANHIKTFADHRDLRLEVSNGITLCVPCHRSIRGREQEHEAMFNRIIGATGNN